jgi:hypothetical protein
LISHRRSTTVLGDKGQPLSFLGLALARVGSRYADNEITLFPQYSSSVSYDAILVGFSTALRLPSVQLDLTSLISSPIRVIQRNVDNTNSIISSIDRTALKVLYAHPDISEILNL